MQDHYPPAWINRLAGLMLIEVCPAVTELFTAWARAEGGTARWNPLNTTEPMPGDSTYNSAGVKNYPTPIDGIAATAKTLQLEPYRGLWVDLQMAHSSGLTAAQIVQRNAGAFDTWGTGATAVERVLGV